MLICGSVITITSNFYLGISLIVLSIISAVARFSVRYQAQMKQEQAMENMASGLKDAASSLVNQTLPWTTNNDKDTFH